MNQRQIGRISVTWLAALQIAREQKKVLTCEKSSIPTGFFFVHKHGRRLIVLYTNLAAVTSCENVLQQQTENVTV